MFTTDSNEFSIFALQAGGLLLPAMQVYILMEAPSAEHFFACPAVYDPGDVTLPRLVQMLGHDPYGEGTQQYQMTTFELGRKMSRLHDLGKWKVALLTENIDSVYKTTALAVERDFGPIGEMAPPPAPTKTDVDDLFEQAFFTNSSQRISRGRDTPTSGCAWWESLARDIDEVEEEEDMYQLSLLGGDMREIDMRRP
jgi:hypothetical protein